MRDRPDGPQPRDPSLRGMTKGTGRLAEQAARLCKADLVTEMVGEFPELQGLMGGYYARAEGLPRRSRRRHPRSLQAGRAGRRSADRAGDGGGEPGGQAGYSRSASSRSMSSRRARKIPFALAPCARIRHILDGFDRQKHNGDLRSSRWSTDLWRRNAGSVGGIANSGRSSADRKLERYIELCVEASFSPTASRSSNAKPASATT